MYIIIKKDKAEHAIHKLHKVKETICEILDFIEEAREVDRDELYSHDMARGRGSMGRRHARRDEDDYEEDYYEHDMARGRGSRGGRSRY